MSGCISRNLKSSDPNWLPKVDRQCLVVCAYNARNRNMARSSENRLESPRCCALILMLNSVSCTQSYLWSSCDARLMYARMIDLTGFYMQWAFKVILWISLRQLIGISRNNIETWSFLKSTSNCMRIHKPAGAYPGLVWGGGGSKSCKCKVTGAIKA